jgi:hypothetical protein
MVATVSATVSVWTELGAGDDGVTTISGFLVVGVVVAAVAMQLS